MSKSYSAVTTDEVVTKKEDLTVQNEPKLTSLDRCDSCGAQAFVRAVFTSGDLLFCGHHAARYEVALEEQALAITDQRDRINVKPSVSANAI